MLARNLSLTFCAIGLLAGGAGCFQQSTLGLDLSVRGHLSMSIQRASGSAQATAVAGINDTQVPFAQLNLTDDQSLTVGGVKLEPNIVTLLSLGLFGQVAALVPSVNSPSTYSISFDDRGTISTMTAQPPQDFVTVTPESGTIPRGAFTINWTPTGESGVTVDIFVSGLTPDDGDSFDDDFEDDPISASVVNLPDTGSATVGIGDLAFFLAGPVTVSVERVKSVPQALGFAQGNVNLRITRSLNLTLTD